VVLFDGPARAVRAVGTVRHEGVALGLSVAEVPVDASILHGPLIDLAVSLADQAGAGQVLASEVAGLLMAGSHVPLSATTTESGEKVFLAG
jgi:hypothetical protein